MAEHVGLYFLRVRRHFKDAAADWVFHGYVLAVGVKKFEEKFFSRQSFVVTVDVEFPFSRVKTASACVTEVGTWREGDYHVPALR